MSMHARPARALSFLVRACLGLSLLLAAAPAEALNCAVFPPDNPWNQRVDSLPVHPRSADYVASMGADHYLHADFGVTDSLPDSDRGETGHGSTGGFGLAAPR